MIYADTNFYTNYLAGLALQPEAASLAAKLTASKAPPLPVTWLLRLEVINGLQQCVFMSRSGTLQNRFVPEMAAVVEAQFFDEADAGVIYRHCGLDAGRVEIIFRELAHRHTAKAGFRTYDILHVASALVLGCDTFWSFDVKAKNLAKREGLAVN
jgi:predicted nucleic acid-binding protein